MERNLPTVAAKKFSKASFDPVPDNRLSHLCADRDSESAFSFVIHFADDDKMGGENPFSPS